MGVLLLVAGLLLVAVALVDAVSTTVAVSAGGGPLTRVTAHVVWRLIQATSHGPRPSRLHRRTGELVMLATVLLWVLLNVAGWLLVFLGSDRAVVDATTGAPAGFVARLYYVGFVVFTLGIGDYVAGSGGYQVLTVVSGFVGLFLVTLAVTYVLSVVSAAVDRQAFASSVSALGDGAEDVVLDGWDGGGFSAAFVQHLVQLSAQVTKLAEQHLAYPVLHFFVARQRSAVAPLGVQVLDDAVTLLEHGVRADARPATSATRPVARSIDRYLTSVIAPDLDADVPPAPDLSRLVAAGIPVDAPAFAAAVEQRADRRRRLNGLVRSQGWS